MCVLNVWMEQANNQPLYFVNDPTCDSGNVHYSLCIYCMLQNCPKLSIKSRGHVVVETRGEKKIYDALKELNERIRRKAQVCSMENDLVVSPYTVA